MCLTSEGQGGRRKGEGGRTKGAKFSSDKTSQKKAFDRAIFWPAQGVSGMFLIYGDGEGGPTRLNSSQTRSDQPKESLGRAIYIGLHKVKV